MINTPLVSLGPRKTNSPRNVTCELGIGVGVSKARD